MDPKLDVLCIDPWHTKKTYNNRDEYVSFMEANGGLEQMLFFAIKTFLLPPLQPHTATHQNTCPFFRAISAHSGL